MSNVQLGVLQRAAGSIPNSRLLAMVGNPVTLIPAPGAGFMIRPTTIRVWTCVGAGGAGTSGLTRNSAAVTIGYHPAESNGICGDGTLHYTTAPAQAQGLWGGAAIVALTNPNTAMYFECQVQSTTGVLLGQYTTSTPASYNAALELAVTTGDFTNTSTATTTLQWEVLYYLVQVPQFT